MAGLSGPTTIQGDMFVNGTFTAANNTPSAGSITDALVSSTAGIGATKVQRINTEVYSQPNTTATSETRVIQVVRPANGAAASEFSVGCIAAAVGAATVTVDLKVDGSSILSGVVTIDNTLAAYTPKVGTITAPTLVQGNVLTIVITATASGGTLPTGVFACLKITEAAI